MKSIPDNSDGPCGYSVDENDPDDYAANEDKEWILRDFVRIYKESIFLTKSRLMRRISIKAIMNNRGSLISQCLLEICLPIGISICSGKRGYWSLERMR